MITYVINLEKRPDRLAAFKAQFDPNTFSTFHIVSAVDGTTLNIPELTPRIHPWNLKNLTNSTLRGVIGCALSHLQCYRSIQSDTSTDNYFLIFEDDAMFINSNSHSQLNDLLSNFNSLSIPDDLGILFLNDWLHSKENISPEQTWGRTDLTKTTESYIIHKDCAKYLYDSNINNLGAIDAHIFQSMQTHSKWNTYVLSKPIFIQRDRRDSNIR